MFGFDLYDIFGCLTSSSKKSGRKGEEASFGDPRPDRYWNHTAQPTGGEEILLLLLPHPKVSPQKEEEEGRKGSCLLFIQLPISPKLLFFFFYLLCTRRRRRECAGKLKKSPPTTIRVANLADSRPDFWNLAESKSVWPRFFLFTSFGQIFGQILLSDRKKLNFIYCLAEFGVLFWPNGIFWTWQPC